MPSNTSRASVSTQITNGPVMLSRLTPTTIFALNILLIILLGVSLSLWLLHYTTFLPEVVALLTLGGVFTWITVVSKALPESRIKELQKAIEHSVLMKRATSIILFLLTSVFVALATFLGSIKITPGTEPVDHYLKFRPLNIMTWSDPEQVVPHNEVKEVFWTAPFSERHVEVKISGYPTQLVTVKSWRTSQLYVPYSFLRPVILLRPTLRLAAHGQDHLQLVVTVNGRKYKQDFQGQSFWVGCDEDVFIPGWLQDSWRADLISSPFLATAWLHPKSMSPDLVLGGVQFVDVELISPATTTPFSSVHVPVIRLKSVYDFPQEVILDVPKKENPDNATQ
jgi:hypothetical protein